MSDPDELRALAGKMAEAAIYRAIDLDGFWAISPEDAAQVAIDHYAPIVAEVERLRAIEAAANETIVMHDAPPGYGRGYAALDRLRAALEGGTDE